jgi:hypothetical protein
MANGGLSIIISPNSQYRFRRGGLTSIPFNNEGTEAQQCLKIPFLPHTLYEVEAEIQPILLSFAVYSSQSESLGLEPGHREPKAPDFEQLCEQPGT